MEKEFILIMPSIKDRIGWLEYYKEFKKVNPDSNPLDYRLGQDYEQWLSEKEDESKGLNLQEGRVPSSVYLLKIEGNDRILGHVSIRHSIDNEFLEKVGGHIGYGIRPSERGKGYAKILLNLALKICKELGIENVMITCKKNNIPSAKCIKSNGGILRDEINYKGEDFNRYDFKLD